MSAEDIEGGGVSDETLVAAYVDGSRAAFDALVQRYERRVYGICHRYFGNAADAEDAAQEAFVALLRRASTFKGTSSFATWMFRVATNACNDLARKRARRPQAADEDVERALDRAAAAPGVEEVLASDSLDADLVAALRTLDDATREAVVLHDVYGLAYHEIAQRGAVAVGTVKSRIHRGHARLAAALASTPAEGAPRGSREPFEPSRPPTPER